MRRAVVVGLALLCLAPSGAAAAGWSSGSNVGGRPSVGPFVGVADDGEAVAQWHEPRGVFVAIRRPGRRFGRPVRIGGRADLSYMTVGAGGHAIAVWRARARGNPVYVALRRPGRPFGRRRLVARNTASFPLAAIDGRGRFGVAWTQGKGDRGVIRFQDGRAGVLGKRQTLSDRGATSPVVGAADGGDFGVAWIQGTEDDRRGQVVVRTRAAGAAEFETERVLSPAEQSTGSPRIAVGARGSAVVVWRAAEGGQSHVWAAPADGSAPVQKLSGDVLDSGDPAVAMSADGETTVTWVNGERDQQGTYTGSVHAAVKPPGGAFGTGQGLNDFSGGNGYLARLDVNPRGDTAVLWTSESPGSEFAQDAVVRPRGGAFGAPDSIEGPRRDGLNGDVGLDAAGAAVAAWVDLDDEATRIRAAFYAP